MSPIHIHSGQPAPYHSLVFGLLLFTLCLFTLCLSTSLACSGQADPPRPQETRIPSHRWSSKTPVTALALVRGESLVAVGSQRQLVLLGMPALQPVQTLDPRLDAIHDLIILDDVIWAAGGSAGESGILEKFEISTGRRSGRYELHNDVIISLATHLDYLVTASLDGTVKVFDPTSEKTVLEYGEHSKRPLSVASTGELLISTGLDSTLRVWKIGEPATAEVETVRVMTQHQDRVGCLAVRPKQEGLPMIASASGDRTLRFWQPTIGRMVRFRRFKSRPSAIAWSPDGRVIFVALKDGQILGLDPDSLEQKKLGSSDSRVTELIATSTGKLILGNRNEVRLLSAQ